MEIIEYMVTLVCDSNIMTHADIQHTLMHL
jgi:hypothetical protein